MADESKETQAEYEARENREYEARQVLLRERARYVTPGCCEVMRRCKVIVMSGGLQGEKPHWWMRLASNYGESLGFSDRQLVEAQREWGYAGPPFTPAPVVCPYCGLRLPEIVPATAPPAPLMRCSDGNYCDTCGERAHNCLCWPAWFAWEAKVVP